MSFQKRKLCLPGKRDSSYEKQKSKAAKFNLPPLKHGAAGSKWCDG